MCTRVGVIQSSGELGLHRLRDSAERDLQTVGVIYRLSLPDIHVALVDETDLYSVPLKCVSGADVGSFVIHFQREHLH